MRVYCSVRRVKLSICHFKTVVLKCEIHLIKALLKEEGNGY